jgi:hypothetical protein
MHFDSKSRKANGEINSDPRISMIEEELFGNEPGDLDR